MRLNYKDRSINAVCSEDRMTHINKYIVWKKREFYNVKQAVNKLTTVFKGLMHILMQN
jgi:hypothetical protein